MGPVEIITIIVAVAIVIAVFATWLVRKLKGKSTGCSGCAGCPYAGNCAHSCGTGKTDDGTESESILANEVKNSVHGKNEYGAE